MNTKCYIDNLVFWAIERGYSVAFEKDGDDTVCRNSKIISIKNTRTKQSQLHTLLHECGHVLIYNNKSVFDYERIEDDYSERSNIAKAFRVMEEVEAWRRGRLLAKRLGITINDVRWNKDVSSAIMRYMEWAAN